MIVNGGTFSKRLAMPLDFRFDISQYGKSNLYPQLVEQILLRSSTTLAAKNALAKYIRGEGFEQNGDVEINRHEQTVDSLLRICSDQYAIYGGFALHFNVDELLLITEITPVDFKDLRYGLPDERGRHYDVKLNMNWERDPYKMLNKTEVIETFPLWSKREQVDFDEIEDFSGFIMYFSPEINQYPRATFDAVLDAAQTDAEVQMYELGNIQNGFLGASIMRYPAKIESDKERRQIQSDLMQLQGSENANSIMLLETPPDFEGDFIENIAANNNDRLFELTNNNVVQRIMNNFAIPYPIAGLQPTQGGVFNSEQVKDSVMQYNAHTRDDRMLISKVLNEVMEFWAGGSTELGEISQLTFAGSTGETDIDDGEVTKEGVEKVKEGTEDQERVETEDRSPEELKAQANLRGSVGGVQGILQIQASVQAGTTSRSSAEAMLTEIYGFSPEAADKLLGEVKEEPETEE